MFAIQCWLFNHESPRRGIEFVTRKITNGVAKIHHAYKNKKNIEPITLGNLNAQRDWTDARDCVRLIWDILNLRKPNEYVIGSGKSYTIKDFIGQMLLTHGKIYELRIYLKLKTTLIGI